MPDKRKWNRNRALNNYLQPSRDFTFRIPKDYKGLLFLVYDVPGAAIFNKDFDIENLKSTWPSEIVIEFDRDGVARVGHQHFGDVLEKSKMVEHETGRQIPLVVQKSQLPMPLPARAAIYDGGGRVYLRKGRREFKVDVFLVGDPAKFPDRMSQYPPDEIDSLLLKHFGLPLPEKPAQKDRK